MVTFQSPLYPLYYLDSDTVAQTNQYISAWEGEPTWQIAYISDYSTGQNIQKLAPYCAYKILSKLWKNFSAIP
jgi:hypothetical protein